MPKKGFQNAPGRPKPKTGQFYRQLPHSEAALVKGPRSPDKRRPNSSWLPQAKKWTVFSATHICGSRVFARPQIPAKASKRLLVTQNHKVASLITISHIGKPASEPASQPAKLMTGFFYPCSAFLGLSMYEVSLGLSGPLWASLCESVPLRGFLGFSGSLYALGFFMVPTWSPKLAHKFEIFRQWHHQS